MSERGHLRVINDHGELDEDSVAIPTREEALVEEIVELRRKLSAARGQITRLSKIDPEADKITRILERWQEKLHPKAQVPLDGSRAKATKKMLAIYTEEQLLAAIDNAAARPWMGAFGERFCCPGPGRKLRDELEMLFRDERHVDELLVLRADEDHLAYRRWLRDLLAEHPKLVPALGLLAVRPPHGDVLAAAAVWARSQRP